MWKRAWRELGHALVAGWPIVALGVFWLILEVADYAAPAFDQMFLVSAVGDDGVSTPTISLFLRAIVVALLLLVCVFASLWAGHVAEGGKRSPLRRAKQEIAGVTSAVEAVVKKLYDIESPRWSFTSVRGVYSVNAAGDCDVTLKYELKAGPQPAQLWRFQMSADNTAKKIDWLEQINFKVELLNNIPGTELRYLVYNNGPLYKEVAIFFLPEIKPNDTREVQITYQWPGQAKDLLKQGKTRFAVKFKSCDPLDRADVQYDFKFAGGLGAISFERLGPHNGDTNPLPLTGSSGWRFHDPALLMDNRTIEFVAERVTQP